MEHSSLLTFVLILSCSVSLTRGARLFPQDLEDDTIAGIDLSTRPPNLHAIRGQL